MSKSSSLTLQSILKQYPPPKSVLIHDSFSLQAKPVLTSMIKHAVRLRKCKVHVFLFENSAKNFKKVFTDHNVLVYDYVSKNNWVTEQKPGDFLSRINNEFYDGIIVIDSLINVIIEYGLAETYRALYQLLYRNDRCIIQFITVLHEDILPEISKIQEYFKNIMTLSMNLLDIPKRSPRVKYYYRKSSSKIIQDTEEYYFEDENFCTRPIERLDAKTLLSNAKMDVQPHELATFKIDLNDNDKKLKDNFTLPYLRTLESEVTKPGEGNIIYNLDENDDWDDEDPDDDLDI